MPSTPPPVQDPRLTRLLAAVTEVDGATAARARRDLDLLAKPPGSLGRLEELACRLAAIARRCPPPVPAAPAVIVVAGDHGVHAQGVSDWPQAVTAAMVATVASGRAGVSAIARTVGARVVVLDVGTRHPSGAPGGGVREQRVRAGTRDLAVEAAMTSDECADALAAGAGAAAEEIARGADCLALGDLGIANTTASACLIAALTGAEPREVTGTGANLDDTRLATKIGVVERALARHGDARDPLDVLASLGGLEHAALTGAILAAAGAGLPVVLDGVTVCAAALVAVALAPDVSGHLLAGHRSPEPGAGRALGSLGLTPLLDLSMRLGEGTGATLAIPLVQAAARILAEMATLAEVADG